MATRTPPNTAKADTYLDELLVESGMAEDVLEDLPSFALGAVFGYPVGGIVAVWYNDPFALVIMNLVFAALVVSVVSFKELKRETTHAQD